MVLAALIVGVAAVGVSTGPAGVGFVDALRIFAAKIGIGSGGTEAQEALVFDLRLPRVLLALLAGATLALAGTVMQAVFRNPLAEPGVTGVSSGAATVAVIMIVAGIGSPWQVQVGAFIGALGTVFVVQVIAGVRGGAGATLLLVGIAVNAFLGAIISAVIANAPSSDSAKQALFWLNGDLSTTTWPDVRAGAVPMVAGSLVLLACLRDLNLLLLGEEHAGATGMNTKRTRHVLLAFAALVTAGSVAVTGVISFVGLVVPHAIRLVVGNDHRRLVPLAMAFGAVFLASADIAARNVLNPVILQTGTVTALVGAPVLLYLVSRTRSLR